MPHMTESVTARFYVATNGDDAWSGRHPRAAADGTDGPFATLKRARDAVRELTAWIRGRDAAPEGEIAVMVRAGTYYLPEPLQLGPADAGSDRCPVTYTAYPGEEPVLSGGRRLTEWEPFAGEILRCRLPDDVHGELAQFRQLMLDGRRQRRARWPKFDPANPIYGGWAFVEGPAEEDSHNAFVYRAGTFRHRWASPQQIEINIYPFKAGATASCRWARSTNRPARYGWPTGARGSSCAARSSAGPRPTAGGGGRWTSRSRRFPWTAACPPATTPPPGTTSPTAACTAWSFRPASRPASGRAPPRWGWYSAPSA